MTVRSNHKNVADGDSLFSLCRMTCLVVGGAVVSRGGDVEFSSMLTSTVMSKLLREKEMVVF